MHDRHRTTASAAAKLEVFATWPDGFSVRLEPVELIGPYGQVLAREGDVLYAAGGIGADGTFSIGPLERQEDWDRRQDELRRAPRDRRGRLPNR